MLIRIKFQILIIHIKKIHNHNFSLLDIDILKNALLMTS